MFYTIIILLMHKFTSPPFPLDCSILQLQQIPQQMEREHQNQLTMTCPVLWLVLITSNFLLTQPRFFFLVFSPQLLYVESIRIFLCFSKFFLTFPFFFFPFCRRSCTKSCYMLSMKDRDLLTYHKTEDLSVALATLWDLLQVSVHLPALVRAVAFLSSISL